MININSVAILGANGAMGQNVAGIFSSFGDAKVYLISRNLEDSIKAKVKAINSIKAESVAQNLIPVTYEDVAKIIPKCDLIFESVSENLDIKREVFSSISPYLKEGVIIASGTSGLSINALSTFIPKSNRNNFLGIHFFNPPYSLSLCEVIPSTSTSEFLIEEINDYLEKTLLRTVVTVKDVPGFLANRIGFQFINELFQLAEEFSSKGGISYIDTLFGGFSGRSMAPLYTANFVGLDVHKAIVDNIYSNTNDYKRETFILPKYLQVLIDHNLLGEKTKKGIYFFEENSKKVFDIEKEEYVKIQKYEFSFITDVYESLKIGEYDKSCEKMLLDKTELHIIMRLLLSYVTYALFLSLQTTDSIHSADHAMANGFGWIPPLALIDYLGGKEEYVRLAKSYKIDENIGKDDFEKIIENITESNYDFRPFLKAK